MDEGQATQRHPRRKSMKDKSVILTSGFIAACLILGLVSGAANQAEPPGLAGVTIRDGSDAAALRDNGVPVYGRMVTASGTMLLVGARPAEVEAMVGKGLEVAILDSDPLGEHYYIAYAMPGRARPEWADFGTVLYEDGNHALLRMSPEAAGRLAEAGAELAAVTFDPKPFPRPIPASAAPAAIEPDSVVQEIIRQVDSLTVYTYTGDLSGEWPVTIGGSPYTIETRHTYSGEPIEKATDYVGEHLEALGLSVEYHEWGDSTYPNVIAELAGEVSPDSIFIICGHLDDMPSGPVAPGADDNSSGSVAVLVAADILTNYRWPYTLRFALWTGEEQGLWGSYYYAQRSYNWDEDIIGVLNLDMIAYNTTGSDPDIDLHADSSMPATLDLAQLFADVVDAYDLDLIPQIVPDGTGASDHASFWNYGYVAILGIEDVGDFNPRYHTTGDQLQYLDMGYYVEFVKASVGTFAHMSGGPLPTGAVADGSWDRHEDATGLEVAVLHAARPNPVTSSTVIRYGIAEGLSAELSIYDARGRLVRNLRAGHHAPGTYEVVWNGETDADQVCAPGVYYSYLRLDGGYRLASKLVLLR
jgi:hypothetical protein